MRGSRSLNELFPDEDPEAAVQMTEELGGPVALSRFSGREQNRSAVVFGL